MTPRTAAPPPNDPRLWWRLLSRVHPDAGGDGELFIWTAAVRDVVCGGEGTSREERHESRPYQQRSSGPPPDNRERVPYPSEDSSAFAAATAEAQRLAGELGLFKTYGGLLAMLADCEPLDRYARQQERGASYKQLAAIAHVVGMSKAERIGWYRLAESIPLSDRHAGHLLGRLKAQAA